MTARALTRLARGLAVAGVVLLVDGLYVPAAADLDNGALLLVGLFAAYVAVSVKGRRPAA